MGLETGTFIDDLVATNPISATDLVRYGASHLRLIKQVLQGSFAGSTGAILVAGADVGTVNAIVINPVTVLTEYTTRMLVVWLQSISNTGATTINISGLGAKPVVSVSNAALASGDLILGRVYVGIYDGTSIQLAAVTKNYVDQLAFLAALPAQTGNAGKFVTTNGTSASWAYANISTVNATITTDTTLSGQYLYVPMAMTALGKSITLPSATGLALGGPIYIIQNSGGYAGGVRDNAGNLLTGISPNGVAYLTLKDNSTAAGVWGVVGDNLEPGLITYDGIFSATYSGNYDSTFVNLDDNKSIHFLRVGSASGFAAFCFDRSTNTAGTPLVISATADWISLIAFEVTATSIIVFMGNNTTALAAVVVYLDGVSATSLAKGTASSTITATTGLSENADDAPKIAQADATHYLLSYSTGNGSGLGNTTVVSFEVTSSTTVTASSAVNIITSNSVPSSTTTHALTSTTYLVTYSEGGSAPYTRKAVVINVASNTPNVNAPVSASTTQQSGPKALCILSSGKVITQTDLDETRSQVQAITVSGVSLSIGSILTVETGLTSQSSSYGTRLVPNLFPLSSTTALLNYDQSGGNSRQVVITENSGTLTKGDIRYGFSLESGSYSGKLQPQGTSEIISIFRNSQYGNATINTASIVGTVITPGNSSKAILRDGESSTGSSVRFSNGVYVNLENNSSTTTVFKSNGAMISLKGQISVPGIDVNIPYKNSTSSIVLKGGLVKGSTTLPGQFRMLNLEIAI